MTPRTRIRARRIVAGLVALGLSGWWFGPNLWTMIRINAVERALGQGQLDRAESWLGSLLRDRPESTRVRLLQVQVARRQGRITDAEEVLQRLVETGLPVEQARREHALIQAAQNLPAAERSLRAVLRDHPRDAEVRQALASLSGLAQPSDPGRKDEQSPAPSGPSRSP